MNAVIAEAIKGNILAILIVIFVVSIIATIAVTAWVTKMNFRSGSTLNFIGKTEVFMKEIRDDIKEIFKRLGPATTTAESPLVLSDLGKKIAEEIEVVEWSPEYTVRLREKLKDQKDPYEIQEVCFEYAQNKLLDNLLEDNPSGLRVKMIRGSAYENGLELKQVLDVVGIVLRDNLLKLCELDTPHDLPIPPPHTK